MSAITKTSETASAGFPFASILTLIFVVAKLTGVIAWSWWIVFCPLWIGLAVLFAVLAVFVIIGLGIFLSALTVGLWKR